MKQQHERGVTRRLVSLLVAFTLGLLGVVGVAGTASADETPLVSGSSWLGGNGVNVCAPGLDPTCGGQPHVGGAPSVNWWECVELAQRVYHANGWYTGTSSGIFPNVGIAEDIYNQAAAGNLSKMSAQPNGSITSIVPGDLLVFAGGLNNTGHVGVVNSIKDNNDGTKTVNVVNQNAYEVGSNVTWNLAAGTVSKYWYMTGKTAETTFSVMGIVHSSLNTTAATTSPLPSAYEDAFQANTNTLNTFATPGGGSSYTLGMMPGTSPSIAAVPSGGFVEAFQANTGDLYVVDSNGAHDTNQGMASGTSPSIAATSSGYRVAFQANNGNLYIYDSSAGAYSLNQGMASGTSPSIAATPSGSYDEAFQANNNTLYIYNASGSHNTGMGMAAGTSPALAVTSGSDGVAFQANTGSLYMFDSSVGGYSLNQGMMAGTSPAITVVGNGFVEAFQANNGNLYVYDASGSHSTNQGMASGTSPAIATANGTAEVAFQANNGGLYNYDSTNGSVSTNQGMASGTSPTIAG